MMREGCARFDPEQGYYPPPLSTRPTFDRVTGRVGPGQDSPQSYSHERPKRPGIDGGRTALSLTPGVRLALDHGSHVLMAGVDIPVGGVRTQNATYWLTYVLNF